MEREQKPMFRCECGRATNLSCDGCGRPVCSACCTRQLVAYDRKTIAFKHYCPECSKAVLENPWDPVYWKKIVTL